VDVLLEGIQVEQGKDLVAGVVGPVRSKDLLFDGTGIPVKTRAGVGSVFERSLKIVKS
jgi:hypothetical protein